MKLRPFDALKFFAILFPVMVGLRWVESVALEPVEDWPRAIALSALGSLAFSLLYTAYWKPKT